MNTKNYLWSPQENKLLNKLSSAQKIQTFLNSLPYNSDNLTRSVRGVFAVKKAHCFDGALCAAAAIEYHGGKPLLVDMRSSKEDDDHVLAIFKVQGLWGAVAKSNYVTCRYRDPVYLSLRELIMSYFDGYFNLAGKKTLREYSDPLDLSKVKKFDWRFSNQNLDPLGDVLEAKKHYKLLPKNFEKYLSVADDLSFRGGTLGIDPKGAHKVRGSRL